MKFPGLSAVPESIWAGRPTRRSPKSFPVVPGIQPEPSVIAVLAPFWKFWNLFPFSFRVVTARNRFRPKALFARAAVRPLGGSIASALVATSTLRTSIAYRIDVGDARQGEDIGIKRVVHVRERCHLALGDFVSLLHLFDGKKRSLARNRYRGRGLP